MSLFNLISFFLLRHFGAYHEMKQILLPYYQFLLGKVGQNPWFQEIFPFKNLAKWRKPGLALWAGPRTFPLKSGPSWSNQDVWKPWENFTFSDSWVLWKFGDPHPTVMKRYLHSGTYIRWIDMCDEPTAAVIFCPFFKFFVFPLIIFSYSLASPSSLSWIADISNTILECQT